MTRQNIDFFSFLKRKCRKHHSKQTNTNVCVEERRLTAKLWSSSDQLAESTWRGSPLATDWSRLKFALTSFLQWEFKANSLTRKSKLIDTVEGAKGTELFRRPKISIGMQRLGVWVKPNTPSLRIPIKIEKYFFCLLPSVRPRQRSKILFTRKFSKIRVWINSQILMKIDKFRKSY